MLRLNNYTKLYVLSGEDRTIWIFGYTFDGFHFMQNQIKPKILPPVRLCILIIISILGHLALKLHNLFCLQNKDAISYQTFTGNALTLSKYNQSAMTKKLKLQYAKQI